MEPTIRTGAMVLAYKADYQKLKVDDVITFEMDNGNLNTHRIIDITSGLISTRGDNNYTNDAHPTTEITYRYKVLFIYNWTAELDSFRGIMLYIIAPIVGLAIFILVITAIVNNRKNKSETGYTVIKPNENDVNEKYENEAIVKTVEQSNNISNETSVVENQNTNNNANYNNGNYNNCNEDYNANINNKNPEEYQQAYQQNQQQYPQQMQEQQNNRQYNQQYGQHNTQQPYNQYNQQNIQNQMQYNTYPQQDYFTDEDAWMDEILRDVDLSDVDMYSEKVQRVNLDEYGLDDY